MTRTEKEMTARGFEIEETFEKKSEAEVELFEVQMQSGRDAVVRKSASGWTIWIETDESDRLADVD